MYKKIHNLCFLITYLKGGVKGGKRSGTIGSPWGTYGSLNLYADPVIHGIHRRDAVTLNLANLSGSKLN